MKKALLFLMTMLSFAAFASNDSLISVAAYGSGITTIFTGGKPVATTTEDSAVVCERLNSTQNTMVPSIQDNQVLVNGVWVTLPKPANELRIAVAATAAIAFHAGIDTLYAYLATDWVPVKAGFPTGSILLQLDVMSLDPDDLLFGAHFSVGPNEIIGYRNISGTIQGGVTPPPPGTTSFRLLNSTIQPSFTDDSVRLGEISIPIDSFDWEHDEQIFCNHSSTWCIYAPKDSVVTLENTTYLLWPIAQGLDDATSRYYTYYDHHVLAKNDVQFRFADALDKPIDVAIVPKMYMVNVRKKAAALDLGFRQRVTVNRMIFPNDSNDLLWFGYAMNIARESESGGFEFVNGRSGGPTGYLCRTNRYGEYQRHWRVPAADSHDLCETDGYVAGIGYYQTNDSTGIGYWHPPVVLNTTGQWWTVIPGSENFPGIGVDTCIALSAIGVNPDNIQDRDHANSISMFFLPAKGKYQIIKSSRHAAPWPLGAPVSGFEFDETSGVVYDTALTAAMNRNSFAFGRSGGHDLGIELALSNMANNEFVLSQYDNRMCDTLGNPSWAHSARFKFINGTGTWEVTDMRAFEGEPSSSQGSVSIRTYEEDTLIAINAGGVDRYVGVEENQPLTIRSYTTGAKVAGVGFDAPGGPGAYQANLIGQPFETPGFKAHLEEVNDSVRIVMDSLPNTGTWYIWLSESKTIQAGSAYTVPKRNSYIIYISGRYSDADSFPNMSASWTPNRWVSDPQLLRLSTETTIREQAILNFGLFPNPTTDVATVTTTEKGTVCLLDLSGKTLLTKDTDGLTSINTAGLSPGIYIVSFTTKHNLRAAKKLVKL